MPTVIQVSTLASVFPEKWINLAISLPGWKHLLIPDSLSEEPVKGVSFHYVTILLCTKPAQSLLRMRAQLK